MRETGLARLAGLFKMVEDMRGLELRVARAAVMGVERACAAEVAAAGQYGQGGRGALVEGDRAGWACAELMRESAELCARRLRVVLEEREDAADEALEVHRESRMKTEQMERVVQGMRAEQALVQGRREQAGADDRFAARAAWMEGESARMRLR